MGLTRISSFRTLAVVSALIAGAAALGIAQERERSQIPDRFKWNLADIYPNDAAWRAAKDALASQVAELAQFQGKLGSSPATLADALDRFYGLDKSLSRLFVYASMLADQDTRDSQHQGMKQEMTELAASFSAQASFIEPEILKLPKGTVEKFVAAEPRLEDLRVLPGRHRPSRAPHAQRPRGEDPRRRRTARRIAVERLQHPDQRRLSLPDGDAERRQSRSTEPGQLHRLSRRRQSPGSRDGDGGVFQGAWHVQPDLRHHHERRSAEAAVFRQDQELSFVARDAARRPEHSGVGLHPPDRRREQEPVDVPSVSRPSQADDGCRRAPLLRPLRAAGRLGPAHIHARGIREAHSRRPSRRSDRNTRRRSSARSTSAGSISFPIPANGRAPTRTAGPTTSTRSC